MTARLHCYLFAALLLLCASFADAQNVRWDLGAPGSAGVVTTTGGGQSYLVTVPNVSLHWCQYPANAVPCTNYANTFPSLTSISACATNAQIVLQGTNACIATSDNFGNLGVYTKTGTYSYTITVSGVSYGPYTVSVGGGGSSSSGGFGVDATTFPGADPCVQIQGAIYGSPAGSIINATGFTTIAACSVNPFQAPSQSNPTSFSGMPNHGLLWLPGIAFPMDVPFYIPGKWRVMGVGGYGTDRTVIQPSATFLANRAAISAAGTGASGCTSSGAQTVVISGTAIATPANLIGMYVQCASNASATAVPTPQNAEIGGIVTAVSGSGPYTLTLGGAGSAGTVSNTGWTINPVVAAWSPTVVFGSLLEQISFTCSTPASGNVTGCITFLDFTANESGRVQDVSFLNFDYIGLGIFSAQSQNGGTFNNITLNWSNTGNNSTIGVEVGGTGFNSSGGGGTGLCAPGNPCSGSANRGFHGLTILGSAANTGGIGIDVNASNITITDSHCESMQTCVLIGFAAAAQGVGVESVTGCTNVSCAIASVVDISANYATGSAPAPTQNVVLKRVARAYATTWNFRDFITLVGVITDPTASYTLGSAGASGRMVFTETQQMSCITAGGAADSNGAHCAPASQIQIISKLGGRYFADAFNATTDVCLQMNNAMQWVAVVQGITSGAIIDASGFNRNSGYPCATNPFAGTLGTTIPASGTLKLGLAKFFLTTQWVVPANWIVQGSGGNGIGAAGASGTLLSPNISNTANANYANDSTAGTVTTTAGSYTVTGAGSSWTTALIGHYFMACAVLPCTTQALMTGGIITGVGSTTSITLDVPAQASVVAGGAYTITAPLVQNAGIIRDVGIDGNSYGTGGGNGNGGFVGVFQIAGAAGGSYLDSVTIAHTNAVGIDASGVNNLKLRNVAVAGNGIASSVFNCLAAPQGIGVDGLICQSGTSPNPTLSFGVMASGSGFRMNDLTFQNVNIGVELAVNPNFSTNNITMSDIVSGSGATTVTTLVDIAGVSSGGNGPNLTANLFGMQCSACTNIINDHLSTRTLTDAVLGFYLMSRTDGSGNRTILTDSITSAPNLQIAGTQTFLGGAGKVNVGSGGSFLFTTNIGITSGAGIPAGGTCTAANGGSIWLRTDGTTTTTLYVCDNSTHVWTAK